MSNTELLKSKGMLGNMRLRFGAANESDPNEDAKINDCDPYVLVSEFCKWTLGNDYWWIVMEKLYCDLKELKESTSANS